jgi:dihydrofolate reductase
MRKLIYYVATTVDGFICHRDHSLDGFLGDGDHATEYLNALKHDYDTVIMGRNTYELGVRMGVTNPYPWMRQYIVSTTMAYSLDVDVQLISRDLIVVTQALKREDGKNIYLAGGAQLAATLLGARMVDEIIVKVNPVVFGAGISLATEVPQRYALILLSSKTHNNGVVVLRYGVNAS